MRAGQAFQTETNIFSYGHVGKEGKFPVTGRKLKLRVEISGREVVLKKF
ncbi:hypothetical protein KKC1_12570 [Calderihabitans maritimus]|uniref:Uncharacterized protein n=1 Tax=Calderihabitans maritimus TaxID=1246530 RepID=A0A1Z5HRN1_9FIRM|nr:hypothetical protein KKC1_12570 [Calderihabitans maritimus]